MPHARHARSVFLTLFAPLLRRNDEHRAKSKSDMLGENPHRIRQILQTQPRPKSIIASSAVANIKNDGPAPPAA
jgi:hypothetical protein